MFGRGKGFRASHDQFLPIRSTIQLNLKTGTPWRAIFFSTYQRRHKASTAGTVELRQEIVFSISKLSPAVRYAGFW
jgi:hypothetical protein